MVVQGARRAWSSREGLLAASVAVLGVAVALHGASSIAYFIRDRHFGSYGGEFTRVWVEEGLTGLGYLIQAAGFLYGSWALAADSADRARRLGCALVIVTVSFGVLAGAYGVSSWIYVQHRYLHTAGTGALASFVGILCLGTATIVAAQGFLGGDAARNHRLRRAATVTAIGFAFTAIGAGLAAKAWGDRALLPDSYVASLWIIAGAAVVVAGGWVIAARSLSASGPTDARDQGLATAAAVGALAYLIDGIGRVIREAGFAGSGWSRVAGWVEAGHPFVFAFGLVLVALAFRRARSGRDPR